MNTLQTKNRSIIAFQSLFFGLQLFAASFIFAAEKTPTLTEKVSALYKSLTTPHIIEYQKKILPKPFFTSPLKIDKQSNYPNVHFVKDAEGKEFVLKFHDLDTYGAIKDALGAHIGNAIGIPVNQVKIFRSTDPSVEIENLYGGTKTLHTRMPGKEVGQMWGDKLKYDFSSFDISILRDKKQLTLLTKNTDLPKIVALDTYLQNNRSRHNKNILYDEYNDRFYAIDMNRMFAYGSMVPQICSFFLGNLNKKLSREENQALIDINKTLHALTSQFPPKELCNLRNNLAKELNYEYSKWDQEKFHHLVEKNFYETKCLQNQLTLLTRAPFLYHTLKHIVKTPETSSLIEDSFWQL